MLLARARPEPLVQLPVVERSAERRARLVFSAAPAAAQGRAAQHLARMRQASLVSAGQVAWAVLVVTRSERATRAPAAAPARRPAPIRSAALRTFSRVTALSSR